MNFRIAMLLSLSGLAACSNTTSEPANEPNDVAVTGSDPAMQPASYDEHRRADTHTDVTTGNDATRAGAAELRAPSDAARPGDVAPSGTGAGSATTPTTSTPSAAGAPVGAQPDNTKVNERDRNAAALTPVDQGNNETDLKITQQIRQAVMGNDSLSFTAKNVKIITNGGKVTLRGPVKTAAERDAIDAAARKVAGTQVDNQIEVKK